MKEYTLERRMINVKTGWFKSEVKPMWCLVEYSTWKDGWQIPHNCERVLLYSEDIDYIEQELANFRG